jgi:hypothetical protein
MENGLNLVAFDSDPLNLAQIKAIVRSGLEKNIESIKSVAGKLNVPNKDFIDDVMKNFDIEISDI